MRIITSSPRFSCSVALSLLLLVHAVLLGRSATLQSATLNEPGHLVAGLSHWETGGFYLYRVNPPLIRSIAALPVIAAGYTADWPAFHDIIGARPVFGMGEDFITVNGRRSRWLITLARLACLPFSVLGAWLCYLWARDLFGKYSGLMACALWCFSPMVLGHAATIAPDAHATAIGMAACYTFWRWLKKPTCSQAILSGFVLGLAELAKTTMVVFYPLWPLLWALYRWSEKTQKTGKRWRSEAGMLALQLAISVYILNAGYLGQGSFTKLKNFQFVSRMLGGEDIPTVAGANRFQASWLGEMPVPFPSDYIIGIDVQQRDFEDFSRPSYLRGRYRAKGWWYYYAYAALIKTPLGTLGLAMLTVIIGAMGWETRARRGDLFVLLLPAITIFSAVSLKSGFSHHSRYMLPCMPFVFVWISQLAVHVASIAGPAWAGRGRWNAMGGNPSERRRVAATGIATASLLAWSIASSLAAFPHSIAYFNAAAGGARNGPEHLLNSNIDWGQDLQFLEKWGQESSAKHLPLYLAFYNYYNPFDLVDDRFKPWPFTRVMLQGDVIVVPSGYYAISVNLLYEFPWPVRDRRGQRYFIDNRPMAYLRQQEPIGWAGYSIRIFTAEQIRRAYGPECLQDARSRISRPRALDEPAPPAGVPSIRHSAVRRALRGLKTDRTDKLQDMGRLSRRRGWHWPLLCCSGRVSTWRAGSRMQPRSSPNRRLHRSAIIGAPLP